jgi:DNA-binding SARP family transcriptional activator
MGAASSGPLQRDLKRWWETCYRAAGAERGGWRVQFRILGPLEVLNDHGRPLVLGGAKQRALLAVLLLHAGQVVSADRLIDELWGEDPPETARSVLQVYVANLRKVLEPGRPKRAASSLLKTQPPGYLLDLAAHVFDLARFEGLADEGWAALAAGDIQTAAIELRRALELWRGPVLGDVVAELANQGVLARLEEQRLAALEQRLEADLALGRHSELVGELEGLVTAHPLRERLRGQLMVALYRCGRQAEALDVYRQTRETLAEELGIDPSRALQDLERAILAQDPLLDWVPPASDAATVPAAAPGRVQPAIERAAPVEAAPRTESPVGAVRRTVTVLCLGVTATKDGKDLDPEVWHHLGESYADELRAVVERHSGTVLELTEEAATVVYGIPTVRENDALRAVRAATEAREAFSSAAVQLRSAWGVDLAFAAGIQTGETVAQVEEGHQLRLVATPARLARQLEQAAAPDEILLDTATCSLVRDAVRVEQARSLIVRGRGEAVATWRLVHVQPRARGRGWRLDAPMVGRSQQLAQLVGAFEAVTADRSCQLFAILGPAGVGKSRLAHECLQTIGDRATVLRGRCLDYGEGITFWALGEMVKARAGILESDGPVAATAKLARAVEAVEDDPAERQWLMARLAPLVGLGSTGQAAKAERAEVFAAWRRFLEAVAAHGPLVLVIEDLHWADEALLDFFAYLMEWATNLPLLLVCTARPELNERAPGWGGGQQNATTIALGPLSDPDIGRLLAALLNQPLVPAELQAALLARAGGNPLYAEEFVRLVTDRGLLERHGRGLRLVKDAEIPVPGTVQALIAARLDALDAERKALLLDAAVVGQVFWSGVVAAMGQREESMARERLQELTRQGFVRPARRSSVAGQAEYVFGHVLMRDVAYGQLPQAVRADKHRRAAEWLETLSPDRAEDRAELLAHHYATALEAAKVAGQDTATLVEPARLALQEAGDRALALHAFAAAVRWYAAALELSDPNDPARPQLLFRLGRAHFHAEQAGSNLLAEARDALLADGDRESAAEAEAMLGKLAWWRGEGERGIEHDQRAAELLTDAPPSRPKAAVLVELAGLLMVAGRHHEAIRVGREGLTIAERLGLDDIRADALNHLGAARVSNEDAGGLADMEQAVALAVRANSPVSVIAYINLASVLVELGDLARGFELQAEGRRVAERFGFTAWLRHLQGERVYEDYWSGHWDAALRRADEFIAESEASSRHYMETACRLIRGRIRLARGGQRAALEDARKGLESARLIKDPQMLNPAITFAATVALAAGNVDQAAALASELLDRLVKQDGALLGADWPVDLAIVLAALGRGEELVELAARSRMPTPWLEGAGAFAAGEFQRAADRYAEIGSLPDEAFARLQAAKRLFADERRGEANAQLERAMAFYRKVRASAYLGEGEALLAASA